NVRLGEGSMVGEYAILGRAPRGKKDGELELVIGPGAVIRPFTTIYAGTRIGARLQTGQGASIREDNVIGDDVSVGTHASLEFGEDALIGAGSVVRHAVPARTVWAGNPAVQLKDDIRDLACFVGIYPHAYAWLKDLPERVKV